VTQESSAGQLGRTAPQESKPVPSQQKF